uniref:MYND-type domain-containing protein n=1 Tax=Globisporangium ultimum (strain ATCC 200006 / CBS 805.95 / DAOM BR144) TaxID=431595 RepID=K3X101_GLOUD
MTTNAPPEALPSAADGGEEGAPSNEMQSLRDRLIAANVLMRYDYAWKEVEFTRADSRLTGIISRLLYQYAMWQHLAAEHTADGEIEKKTTYTVYVDANGYDMYRDDCTKACGLMGFDVLDADSEQKHDADLVFIYIAPPGELRVDSQYATLEQFVAHHRQAATPVNRMPLFCLLKGEAEFLEPPHDDEAERLRGLSEFAISQQLHPHMQEAKYSSIAQFAVEFTPSVPNADHESGVKQVKLEQLMSNFGCVDHNLMHYTEKWEFYAPQQSVLCNDDAVIHTSDDDALYWLEYAKDKTCHYCHTMTAKLSRCARCHDARYCSRDCQRSAWKFHKRLCGKTPEEISS